MLPQLLHLILAGFTELSTVHYLRRTASLLRELRRSVKGPFRSTGAAQTRAGAESAHAMDARVTALRKASQDLQIARAQLAQLSAQSASATPQATSGVVWVGADVVRWHGARNA